LGPFRSAVRRRHPALDQRALDRGQGWEDLFGFDKTGGGKSIVFGDIVYATAVVPEETETWGSIKSLYR
jgi:hypothetical protein